MPPMVMPDEITALPHGGVRALLRELGYEDEFAPAVLWTGCIHLTDVSDRTATIWLDEGAVYAAHMSGYTPSIALRLRSAGCLSDEEYAVFSKYDADVAGPAAVSELNVSSLLVEEIHREVMLATVSHLYEWENALWWWEDGVFTDKFITAGIPLLLVTSAVDERIGQWNAVVRQKPEVVQPNTIPLPGPAWESKTGAEITPEMVSLLMKVNGRATVAQIAATCGFTRFEIARLLAQASVEGVLIFAHQPASVESEDVPVPVPLTMEPQMEPVSMDTDALPEENINISSVPNMGIDYSETTPDELTEVLDKLRLMRSVLDEMEINVVALMQKLERKDSLSDQDSASEE